MGTKPKVKSVVVPVKSHSTRSTTKSAGCDFTLPSRASVTATDNISTKTVANENNATIVSQSASSGENNAAMVTQSTATSENNTTIVPQVVELDISTQQAEQELDDVMNNQASLPITTNVSTPMLRNNRNMQNNDETQFRLPQDLRISFNQSAPGTSAPTEEFHHDNFEDANLKEVYLHRLKSVIPVVRAFDNVTPTIIQLQHQLDMLDKYYNRLIAQIEKLNSLNLRPLELMDNARIIDEADELYENIRVELLSRIESLRQMQQPPQGSAAEIFIRERERSRSRQTIEPFSGNYQKWPNFKSKFEQFYHNDRRFSELEKFLKLDEFLVPDSEAYHTISGYDRVANNYNSAWEDMCDRFDNPRKIVEDIIYAFMNEPCLKTQSRRGTTSLLNSINHLTKTLPRFNVNTDTWGPIIVAIIQRKMDTRTYNSWLKVRPPREISTLDPLINFLTREADAMDNYMTEQAESATDANKGNNNARSQRSNVNNSVSNAARGNNGPNEPRQTPATVKCVHCGNPHQLFRCPNFRKLNPGLRLLRVQQYGVCEKCLKPNCHISKCSLGNCPMCQGPHNGLICEMAAQPSVNEAIMDSE